MAPIVLSGMPYNRKILDGPGDAPVSHGSQKAFQTRHSPI